MFPVSCASLNIAEFSSSANVALYCVIILNRLTRLSSIVFVKCNWAANKMLNYKLLFVKLYSSANCYIRSSVGMFANKSLNQLSRACKNFSFNSGVENACIRLKYPTTCRHFGNCKSVRSCASSCVSMVCHEPSIAETIFCIPNRMR